MDRLLKMQQQSRARYGFLDPLQRKLPAIGKKAVNVPGEDLARYKQLLSTFNLIRPVLAVSYRQDLASTTDKAGAWKQFESATDANSWLSSRARAGARVYTGGAVYWQLGQVLTAYGDPGTPATLRQALKNYLDWRLKLVS